MSRPGQIGHGRPVGSPDRQFADELAELRRQLRETRAMATRAITLATSAVTKPLTILDQSSSLDFTNSWTNYDVAATITPPDGFGTVAVYQVWASAGTTLTTVGNISVIPYVWADFGGGPSYAYGPAIASDDVPGAGGPVTISSIYSGFGGPGFTPSIPLHFGAQVIQNGTGSAAAGNVHVSALAIFAH